MKYAFPSIIPAAIDRIFCKIIGWWSCVRSPLLCWLWGVRFGSGVYFYGRTYIRTHGSGIEIGNNVVFNSFRRANMVGLINPTILENRGGGVITIGNDCGFSSVVVNSKSSVTIGNNVLCGGNVRIFDHDFHSIEPDYRRTVQDNEHIRTRPVVVEDDVFIGTNAIILKGTRIGARSIIAAGSVVFGLEIPPDSMVKGNPAQIVGSSKTRG